jgi:hypothetical protein
MTRLSAILLCAALIAVPAAAQAEKITIVKPPAQPPVQTVGVKPPLGHDVPVLVHIPQYTDVPCEWPCGGEPSDAPTGDDPPHDPDDNPLVP